MFNRRGFFRTLLAAPVAAVVAAGLYKPKPKPLVYSGTFTIDKSLMEKIRPRQTAFNEQMQRMLKELYAEPIMGSITRDIEVMEAFGLNR